MEQLVTIVVVVVGGITVICLAGIAWLAAATRRSMLMKERRQSQELNAQLLRMSEDDQSLRAELLKIRADLQEIRQLLERQRQLPAADVSSGQEVTSHLAEREMRSQ